MRVLKYKDVDVTVDEVIRKSDVMQGGEYFCFFDYCEYFDSSYGRFRHPIINF